MILQRLTKDNFSNISGKKILCIEYSPSYLEEFATLYDALNSIEVIIDDNFRGDNLVQFHGHSIPIGKSAYLDDVDFSQTAIVIMGDYYREHFADLKSKDEMLSRLDIAYYFPNKETSYELSYRDMYADSPLEDIIVFRSGPHASAYVKGMDFSDNARALFEYALSICLNEKYELIWIVNNPKEFEAYKKYRNVSFLPYEASVSEDKSIRDEYYRVLCLAKFFFFTDAYGFVRNCRSDQVRVQLWHGCGYKKRLSRVACKSRYDYMTVTSDLYARLHAREFGLRSDQMLVMGNPKTDWLFEDGNIWGKLLNIPMAQKYIFWLPTYRFSEKSYKKPIDGRLSEKTGLPLISSIDELYVVNEILIRHDVVLVLKLHPFQDRSIVNVKGFSNIVLLDNKTLIDCDIQINQLLGMADALISDYSSTAVDYLILDRPMAFTINDLGDYDTRRGFIFDDIKSFLPGYLISTVDEFMCFVEEVVCGKDSMAEKRKDILKKFHKNVDKNSCKRVMKTLGIEE